MAERNWQDIERHVYMQLVRRLPVTLVRGLGSEVWDDEGRRYLDFVAGWAVNNTGHCHPDVVAAVQKQAGELMMTSNQFYTIPQIELAEMVTRLAGLERVFIANSGAEANEGAVKLARRYGALNKNGAYEVISAWHSFHGRTLATTAATGKPAYQDSYRPLAPGFKQVDFNDLSALREAVTDQTAAILLEPVQGEGGVNVATDDYLKGVRALCDELGLLLILDEIQTGIGRTGSMFAFQQYGIVPDILTLGKGLAGGMPIGAFLASERVAQAFQPGNHGSTFGGNPVVCAAGVATLKVMERENLSARAAEMGNLLMDRLRGLAGRHSFIREVRGKGLLIAVEFDSDRSDSIVRGALQRGLLLNAVAPNAIRIIPPLTIGQAEIDEALSTLDAVFSAELAVA